MALEIYQPTFPKKTFILNRALHLTKDGKIVEEDDPLGVRVLGGKGRAFYEEEAKALGLDESHREGAEAPEPVREPESAPAEPESGPEVVPESEQSPAEPEPEQETAPAKAKSSKK